MLSKKELEALRDILYKIDMEMLSRDPETIAEYESLYRKLSHLTAEDLHKVIGVVTKE